MGEFVDSPSTSDITAPKIFTREYITDAVKSAMERGEIPVDHKLAFFGIVDEKGAKAILSVKIVDKELFGGKLKFNTSVQAVVEHDWTGKNSAGTQLLFSVK